MFRAAILTIYFLSSAVFAEEAQDMDRDPASLTLPSSAAKRTYPGGSDEEDLKVLASLPEAAVRTDARSIQKEVFKTLYNQELKDESSAPVEE